MTMSTCPLLSTILGPGVQLGVPRICLRHIFAAGVQVFTAQQRCMYNSFRLFAYELLDNGGEKAVQWS